MECMVPEWLDDDLRRSGEPSEDKTANEQRVVDVQDWQRKESMKFDEDMESNLQD